MENPPAKRARARPAGASRSHAARRISAKVRAAIDALVSGDCKKICEAAAKIGLARESLSWALSTPHVAEHLRQKVLRHLAIAAARDRASSFVLGLAGTQPASTPSVSLNLDVIDLSDDPQPICVATARLHRAMRCHSRRLAV